MVQATNIRILVLHDDPVTQAGLMFTLKQIPQFELIPNNFQKIEEPSFIPLSRSVDVVIADYQKGVTLASQHARHASSFDALKVVVFTTQDCEAEIRFALSCGVRGYVMVGCALEELVSAVRAVHLGIRHLSSKAAERMAESLSAESLTTRELEVLRLVTGGLGNKSIAKQLGIAVGTVKSHLKTTFEKLNVESRTQAICAATRRGLLANLPDEDKQQQRLAPRTDNEARESGGTGDPWPSRGSAARMSSRSMN